MNELRANFSNVDNQKPLERPGGLRSEASLEIQTRLAQKLVVGRKKSSGKEPIIGMLEFGRRMTLIWLSAEKDDPYADWFLYQIEQSIHDTRAIMEEKNQWLKATMNSLAGFNVDVAYSLKPISVPLMFSNPFGYLGALLLRDFDELACAVFAARHTGLLDRRESNDLTSHVSRAIRRTFGYASQWQYTGVTREDLRQMNQNAARACERMGEVPENFLAMRVRARYAPLVKPFAPDSTSTNPKPPTTDMQM